MAWIKPITLSGEIALIEPLESQHYDGLVDALNDGEMWKLPYSIIPHPDNLQAYIDKQLAKLELGELVPFVVTNQQSNKVAGMTSFYQISENHKRFDIGWTWYSKSQQHTGLNTECKYLLLKHAFEVLGCNQVGFKVDAVNQRSQRAVERLGAKLDGVLRSYLVMPNGNVRDVCIYSILAHEWPHIKTHLEFLISDRYTS